MFVAKIGGVPAHPANVHRLLHDEQQLVLVFPEGAKATEKLYKDRYKLRRFGRGGFVEAAMRAGVPIVPVAVVGAEEAMPTFAQVGLLKRLTGLIYFPITPLFPHFGLLGAAYLPAKFKLRFLEPVRDRPRWARSRGRTRAWSRTSPTTSARRIQDELVDMLGAAPVGVARMSRPARPHHGPLDLLGRPARAGARARPGRRGDRRRQPGGPDLRADPHGVRPRRHPARAARADRAAPPRSTP